MRQYLIALAVFFFFFMSSQEISAMVDITSDQALQIAKRYLDQHPSTHQFVLIPDDIKEHAFGWVIGVAPEQYLRSGNTKYMVPGFGSLVVERNGLIYSFPTAGSPALTIARILREWKARHH
jgi:hypothetical protein